MRFDPPLVRGTLVRRYKRFLADVLLPDGETVVAHCPNSGSMLSVAEPGAEVWISPCDKPGRVLRWTWELVRIGDALVGINTDRPNRLVAEALTLGLIPELAGYGSVRREVRYGRNSRIDLLLEAPDRPTCFVEVKNVTLRRGVAADLPVEFPDSVTGRGTKHLGELAGAVACGHRSVMLYVAQRSDGGRFRFAADIDPDYAAAAREAMTAGVESICYRCRVDRDGVHLADAIPIEWPD
jgi:sugar fermentation stimulation protein A